MADPFSMTPAAPAQPGPGFLGIPASTWQNLANFGANTAVAANARTPQGFLEYGTGPAGALGEGMLQTEQQAKETAGQIAQQALVGAQAQGQQLSNVSTMLQIPRLQAMAKWYSDPGPAGFAATIGEANPQGATPPDGMPDTSGARAAPMPAQNNDTAPYTAGSQASAGGLTPNAPGTEGTNYIGDAVRNVESKNNYSATNPGGYVGAYQFGSANLASTGLYKAAPGEDVSKNQWQGQITVPGYQPMSVAQFSVNKPAQDAAWNLQSGDYWDQIQKTHLDSAIGMQIGGVQITQAALIGGAHFGGVQGITQFLASGGKYNPTDANGTHISDYMNAINQQVVQQQQTGGYDPNTQMNAQDQRGPMLAPGIPTPGKNLQLGQALLQKAQALRIAGLNGDAYQAQGEAYMKMAANATEPQQYRANGGGVDAAGNVVKFSGPTELVGPGNQTIPAAETGGFERNGQMVTPASVYPVTPGQPGGASGAPGAQAAPAPGAQATARGVPQQAQVANAQSNTNAFFDAALTGRQLPPPPPSNQPVLAKPDPYTEGLITGAGEKIQQDQDEADEVAQASESLLTQVKQMKFEKGNTNTDNFAPYIQQGRTTLLSLGHLMGVPDSAMKSLADTAGNTSALMKNTLTMAAGYTHQFSSRPTQNELSMFSGAMPSLSLPNGGFQILADMQAGIAQYNIGYGIAYSKWAGALTNADPTSRSNQLSAKFDPQFNQRITPMAFIANQWMQSPEGQQYLGQYLQYLKGQGTGGQAEIARLRNGLAYGEQTGLFNESAGGGP